MMQAFVETQQQQQQQQGQAWRSNWKGVVHFLEGFAVFISFFKLKKSSFQERLDQTLARDDVNTKTNNNTRTHSEAVNESRLCHRCSSMHLLQ